MQIGTLVKMIGDPHNVLGVITEVIGAYAPHTHLPPHYKIVWIDDLCDPSYAEAVVLEVVCK